MRKHAFEFALIAIIGLLHIPVIASHEIYLLSWFNTDDAFYYFVTAQNIVEGNGATFDGIAHTNGFHPLWMVVILPAFALAQNNPIPPLRAVATIQVLLNIGSAVLLYRLTKSHLASGIAFLTALAFSLIPYIHEVTTKGGLEVGISAFFIIGLLYLSKSFPGWQGVNGEEGRSNFFVKRLWMISSVASLTFLARLDNVFFVYMVGGWLVVKTAIWERNQKKNPGKASSPSTQKSLQGRAYAQIVLAAFLPLTLVVLGYMLWNQLAFGTSTPVSGQVKQWWGTLPNTVYGFPPKRLINYIGQFLTDDRSVGPWSIITAPFYASAEWLLSWLGIGFSTELRRIALAGIGSVAGGTALYLVSVQRKLIWKATRDFGLIPLFLGCLAQIAYYKVSGSVGQRPWYWHSEMLFVILVGGLLLEALDRTFCLRARGLKAKGVRMILFTVLTFSLILPHISRIPTTFQRNSQATSFYIRRANWLESHTDTGSIIAMTGSGSSAYFTQDRVVTNLDGLINSPRYFQHMKNGTAHQYLASIGVDYVFGNEYIVTESDPYGDIFQNRLEPLDVFVDGDKELILWKFDP